MTIRERVLAGETVMGAMVFECMVPAMPQLLALAGAEYCVYDMEHSGASVETIKAQAAFCRGLPVTPMARPPRGEYRYIARLLDSGVKGIMAPMIESAADAEALVSACRYPPTGRRGAAFGFAHDDYAPGDPKAKMAKADAEVLVIAQIETERGLAHADAIAATEGVDVIWIGQADLSNFLGRPGDFESAVYRDACAAIRAAAERRGKAMGVLATSPAGMAAYRAEGYGMLAAGTDQAILVEGYRRILAG